MRGGRPAPGDLDVCVCVYLFLGQGAGLLADGLQSHVELPLQDPLLVVLDDEGLCVMIVTFKGTRNTQI